MVYKSTLWHIMNLILLENPTLTAGEGAQVVRNIKLALRGL